MKTIQHIFKHIVWVLLIAPIALSAQTTTENSVVSKVYRKATQVPVTTKDKDSIAMTIQYIDGLGRPKQIVAVQAGGILTHRNSLAYDWTLGNSGSTPFYNMEGFGTENTIVSGTTPFGDMDLLWECKDDNSGGGSGWITDLMDIDKTKAYRYTTWVKRTGNLTQGGVYHGPYDVNNLDGTTNSNPYFWYGDLPNLDTWYLLVGIVHPSDHTAGDQGISGVYDTQGNKVIDGTEFKWPSTGTQARFRNYMFYVTDTSTRQYFWSPLLQKIDGSELSLDEVLTTPEVVLPQVIVKDIVSPIGYDQYGRQMKDYLAYLSGYSNGQINTDAVAKNQSYYLDKHASDFPGITDPTLVNAYSEKTMENSPLGRIYEQTAPGSSWIKGSNILAKGYSDGHTIKFEHHANIANEVRKYGVTTSFANKTYMPTLTGGTTYYPAGELTKTITKDENWVSTQTYIKDHTTEEFKNKSGQVVLKRTYNDGQQHDTYYAYDDYGNLSYVLPPKAEGTTSAPTSTVLSELCYQYTYDHRNRLVEKKIPGKGWEFIIYDKLDRPVMTQDAVQAINNKWLFTKYDKLGRVAYTGIYTHNIAITRASLQTSFDTQNNISTKLYETKQASVGSIAIYYTNANFPSNNVVIFTANYYEDYVFNRMGASLPADVGTIYGVTPTSNVKGLATGSKSIVLGSNPAQWITTITYYDDKARPIRIYSHNELLETTDIIESKLDEFTGRLIQTKTTHKKTGKTDIVTIDAFSYDHRDRLLTQTQKINNQTSERLVQNHYDELGQLESKLVGNGTQKGYTDVTSGISITDDIITKTGTTGWNEGLATLGSIEKDGYVEYITSHNTRYVVGLSTSNADASYSSIDYGIYSGGGVTQIYESGIFIGNFGSEQTGDVFKVERKGSTIYYKKNGQTFYVSLVPSSGSLIGDVSMYSTGAQIKDLHLVDNSKGLQKVDYSYNVRGWLKNINNDSDNDNDLFNFSLRYNDPTSGTALYNGNISQTSWNTLNTDTSTKTYSYSYDALNRITGAINTDVNYNLTSVSYDKNGNILNLERKGHTNLAATTFGAMDILGYSYDTDSNQLKGVTDTGNVTYGFKDGNIIGDDFVYDVNGNMTQDKNKGITNIEYNHLNLPTKVTFDGLSNKYIEYTYDATGVKLQKKVNNVGTITTTDYAGNYVYEGSDLQFFNHAEGYVKYDGGTTTTLLDTDFETSIGGWTGSGATLSLDNGKLKTVVSNKWSGSQKYLNNVSVGDRIEYNITIDKGTTEKVTLMVIEHDVNNVNLGSYVFDWDASGYYRGTYLVTNANTNKLRIKIEKADASDDGISTEFFIDEATFVKVSNITGDLHNYVYQYKDHLGNVRLSYTDTNGDGFISNPSDRNNPSEIIEESNYYPFGLKHKGYNNATSPNGNSTAQKFKYNGMELENALGIDWYEMDMRQYDPAIARWTSIDPVTHHSNSTYNAFDNNPVYFADPSGADAYSASNGRVGWDGNYGPSSKEREENEGGTTETNGSNTTSDDNSSDNEEEDPPGDYYDKNGNYIRSDNKKDDKVYVVTYKTIFVSGIEITLPVYNYIGQVNKVFTTGDKTTDKRIQKLHPAVRMLVAKFIREANSKQSGNTFIRVSQGFRTNAQQNALYAQGRTKPGSIVTNARGGYSNHNFGLAFDIVGITNGNVNYNLNWTNLSNIGNKYGFSWGGNWKKKDLPHFENTFGNTISQLRGLKKGVNGFVKL